jgi:hypothetical protein
VEQEKMPADINLYLSPPFASRISPVLPEHSPMPYRTIISPLPTLLNFSTGMNKINFRKWLHFIITRDEKHQNLNERVSLTYKKLELFRSPPFKDEKLVGTNRQNSAVNGAIIVSVLWLPKEFIFSTCPRFNVSYLCQLSLDVLVNSEHLKCLLSRTFQTG